MSDGPEPAPATRRSAARYIGLLIVTVLLGLSTRWFPAVFPTAVSQYGGDVLWAAMIFWIAALARPDARTIVLAALALAIACAVEISQLYRAAWIDAFREIPGVALILGQGFLWSDLVCYTLGVLLAATLDAVITTHRVQPGH